MVRHAFLIRLFIGSNPIIPKKISYNGEMEDTLGLGSNSILWIRVQVPFVAVEKIAKRSTVVDCKSIVFKYFVGSNPTFFINYRIIVTETPIRIFIVILKYKILLGTVFLIF